MNDRKNEYPLTGFRFYLAFTEHLLDSGKGEEVKICRGAFSECSGLEATMEAKAIKEGGRNWGVAQRAGKVSFSTVVLKRGVTRATHLWRWFELVAGPAPAVRVDVDIQLVDRVGTPGKGAKVLLQWRLIDALPVKFKAPDLNATNGEVAIEELHLVHEGLRLVAPGEAPS